MAKWGQGDPRWIVEERPDATNVNNWHWSEKDASVWSRDKLNSLLVGLVFEGPEGSCETAKIESVKGEASSNNRKGKLFFFYEWNIVLKWTGKSLDNDRKTVSGEITIPNLSDENEIEDVDITVTVKKDTSEAQKLKELVHRTAPSIIREQLEEYLRCLKEEYSQGLILPQRGSKQPPVQQKMVGARTKRENTLPTRTSISPASKPSGSDIGCRIHTTKLSLTETFMASVEDLYNALTSQELVEAFTRSKAKVEAWKGGVYSILSGQISGEFVELERPIRIVQRWREKSWPDGHYSTVTIELKQECDCTKLELSQTKVPDSDSQRTMEGWKRYIFESIKTTFGFGARLL